MSIDSNQLYQVEDTLNNSNDLFLTFRREMEEMSKKTKRLEKENHNLTRKHDLTAHNILTMAEDRTNTQHELDALRKKNENLEKLCRGMQAQGRGGSATLPSQSSTPASRNASGQPQSGSSARMTNGNTNSRNPSTHHQHPHLRTNAHPQARPHARSNTDQLPRQSPNHTTDPTHHDSTNSSPTTDSDYDDYNDGLDEDDDALDEEDLDDDDYDDEDEAEEEATLFQASAGQSVPPPSQPSLGTASRSANANIVTPPPPSAPTDTTERHKQASKPNPGGQSAPTRGPSPPPLPAPLSQASSRGTVANGKGGESTGSAAQKVVNGTRH